jgi:exopolyphosphatase/pppGpp-phosphohydrolase
VIQVRAVATKATRAFRATQDRVAELQEILGFKVIRVLE